MPSWASLIFLFRGVTPLSVAVPPCRSCLGPAILPEGTRLSGGWCGTPSLLHRRTPPVPGQHGWDSLMAFCRATLPQAKHAHVASSVSQWMLWLAWSAWLLTLTGRPPRRRATRPFVHGTGGPGHGFSLIHRALPFVGATCLHSAHCLIPVCGIKCPLSNQACAWAVGSARVGLLTSGSRCWVSSPVATVRCAMRLSAMLAAALTRSQGSACAGGTAPARLLSFASSPARPLPYVK